MRVESGRKLAQLFYSKNVLGDFLALIRTSYILEPSSAYHHYLCLHAAHHAKGEKGENCSFQRRKPLLKKGRLLVSCFSPEQLMAYQPFRKQQQPVFGESRSYAEESNSPAFFGFLDRDGCLPCQGKGRRVKNALVAATAAVE